MVSRGVRCVIYSAIRLNNDLDPPMHLPDMFGSRIFRVVASWLFGYVAKMVVEKILKLLKYVENIENPSRNREESTQNRTCNVQRATLHVQNERCNAKTRPGRLQEASPQLPVYHFDDHFGKNGRSKADSGSAFGVPKWV